MIPSSYEEVSNLESILQKSQSIQDLKPETSEEERPKVYLYMQEPKRQIISGVPEDQMYLDKEVPKIDNIIKKAVVEELVKVN